MKKYEYKCVSIWGFARKTTEVLNHYGNEGWKLISVWGMWYYFRREKNN
jgi:hypothetical protein